MLGHRGHLDVAPGAARGGRQERRRADRDRQRGHRRTDHRADDAPEEAPLLGQGQEQGLEPADALGRAQEQDAVGFEREMEQRQDPLLDVRLEVDEQIPAADEVHVGVGWVAEQVLRREDHDVPQLLADLPVPVVSRGGEEAPEARRRHVGLDPLRISPGRNFRIWI